MLPIVSGGFATVQPDSSMSINAVEAYPLEDFSPEAVKSLLAEAQKVAAGSGSAIDKAEAEIEIEVCLQDVDSVTMYGLDHDLTTFTGPRELVGGPESLIDLGVLRMGRGRLCRLTGRFPAFTCFK